MWLRKSHLFTFLGTFIFMCCGGSGSHHQVEEQGGAFRQASPATQGQQRHLQGHHRLCTDDAALVGLRADDADDESDDGDEQDKAGGNGGRDDTEDDEDGQRKNEVMARRDGVDAATVERSTEAVMRGSGYGRRASLYLRTEELERLYSSLFRESLDQPNAASSISLQSPSLLDSSPSCSSSLPSPLSGAPSWKHSSPIRPRRSNRGRRTRDTDIRGKKASKPSTLMAPCALEKKRQVRASLSDIAWALNNRVHCAGVHQTEDGGRTDTQ